MVNIYEFHKKTQDNSWVSSLDFDKERERGSEVGEERGKKRFFFLIFNMTCG